MYPPSPTNSDGASNQALAVVPSSNSKNNGNNCDALAPAPLSSIRVNSRDSREEQLARRFAAMEHSARILREEIVAEIFALAESCADSDAFCTGCCAIQKQLGPLNSFLLGAQLAVRLGQPIKKPVAS